MQSAGDTRAAFRRALAIGTLVGIVLGYGAARLASRYSEIAATPSQPYLVPTTPGDANLNEEQERLLALGYSAGSVPAPDTSGVSIYKRGSTYDGYNLYTSGDRPTAFLMDMDGNVLHEWSKSFAEVWNGRDPGEQNVNYWRRVHLFENGDILAIIEPEGIFRLDKDSNLIWQSHCGAHHDLVVEPDGRIFVLAREKQMVDLQNGDGIRPILVDFVVELDSDGKELRRVNLVDALQHSSYAALLFDAPDHWDVLHTNSLKRLRADGMLPAFRAGRFLLSIRELGVIAVLDFESAELVWALKGLWQAQHEATVTESGNVLVFDNKGHHGRSRVVEVNPYTQEIVWTYGVDAGQTLESPLCGLAQRLPNGNTLVTEAVPGRIIEVEPGGNIVWQFVNPNRAGVNAEFVATVMDFQRLPESFHPEWLENEAGESTPGAVP